MKKKKIFCLAVFLMACVCESVPCFGQVNAGGIGDSGSEWKEDFVASGDTAYLREITEDGDAVMLVEVDMAADKLYRYCREWFATKYVAYKQAVQLEDRENGKLIVNCNYPLYFRGEFNGGPTTLDGVQTFKITCDFKEGRYRVKVTKYEFAYKVYLDKFPRSMQTNAAVMRNDWRQSLRASGKAAEFELRYRMMLSGMVRSMKEYIVKADKDDDF